MQSTVNQFNTRFVCQETNKLDLCFGSYNYEILIVSLRNRKSHSELIRIYVLIPEKF